MAESSKCDSKLEHVGEYKAFANPFSYGSSVRLNETNYARWSRTFMMSVSGHRRKHILLEDEPSEKLGKYVTWDEDNDIVMSWIMNSVETHIADGLIYYNTAKQMWDNLRDTYSQETNVSRILQVEQELYNLQQGEQTLAQYYASVKAAFERLNAHRPL